VANDLKSLMDLVRCIWKRMEDTPLRSYFSEHSPLTSDPNKSTRGISRRSLLAGIALIAEWWPRTAVFARQNIPADSVGGPRTSAVPTKITVRVIARGGKFLGDDIGGASITVRDARTQELLAAGNTKGGSGLNGPDGVMCARSRRGEPLPTMDASKFTAELQLDRPRKIEVIAYGPLGALESANTVSRTQWVYPGKDVDAGDGFLLEMSGLIVQILHPPTHYTPSSLPRLQILANVAMMCGCPIDYKRADSEKICPEFPANQEPWLPNEFQVAAVIRGQSGTPVEIPLQFIDIPPADTPGQFGGTWDSPPPGVHQITVYAYQATTGNTGVAMATITVP
jgi:hypothetical protein